MRKFLVLLCAVSLSCVMTGCSGSNVAEVSSVPKSTDTKVESMSYSDFGEGDWVLFDTLGEYGNVYVPSAEENRVGGLQVSEDGSVSLLVGEHSLIVGGGVSAMFSSGAYNSRNWRDGRTLEGGRYTLGYDTGKDLGNYAVGITTSSGEFWGNFVTKNKPIVELLSKELNLVRLQIGEDSVVLYNCGYAIYSVE